MILFFRGQRIKKMADRKIKPMNSIRKIAIFFLGLLILASYKSDNPQSRTIDESELQVLRDIILVDSIPAVYYKTTISELNQPLSRLMFYLDGFDICSSIVNLDSIKLSKEDLDYLVERFSTMEIANINKLIKDPKNHTLKQLKGHNWSVISLPVVFRNGKYAIYYSKAAYSGQFILMKNIDNKWKDVCYSSVWSE